MNKLIMKKLLILLVCLTLITSVFMLAACNKNEIDEEGQTKDETANPSFANGSFASFKTTESGYPYLPDNWTGSPTSDIENIINLKYIVAGAISLESSKYEASKSKWGDLARFEKSSIGGLSDDYDDDNVLMIYNSGEKGYYLFKSGSFVATANTYYKMTVDVRTDSLKGNAEKGASIYLYDYSSSVGISEFSAVDTNGQWTRYTFYIKTKNSSSNLQLRLGLGSETNDSSNPSLTSGYAFFDNVTFEAMKNDNDKPFTNDDFIATTQNLPSDKNSVVDMTVPNSEFDYRTNANAVTSMPAYYEKASSSTSSSVGLGRVNVNNPTDYAKTATALFGSIFNTDEIPFPGYINNDTSNKYAYALFADDDEIGMRTKSSIYFKRGTAYEVSVWVNSDNINGGKAYLALTPNNDSFADGKVISIDSTTNVGWKKYSFIVLSNQNSASNLYLQMWLGKNATSFDKAEGVAFFDKLAIRELKITSDKTLEQWQLEILGTGMSVPSVDFDNYTYDKTSSISDNLLINGYFISDASYWNPIYDYANGFYNNVANDKVTKTVVSATSSDDITIPYPMTDGAITYNNVLKIDSQGIPTLYALGYNTFRDTDGILKATKLKPNTAYRFSIWIKTENVQSTSGVGLTVYQGDVNTLESDRTSLAVYSNINTAALKESEGLNGYRELVFYAFTGHEEQSISFELTFGSGSQWTSATLFDGVAYIANASLIETTYKEFKSAKDSGSFERKYDFNKYTTGTYANDQFDSYDLDAVKGYSSDGIVEGEFQSVDFGTPSSWSLSKSESLSSAQHVYAGIVDLNRPGVINNLKTAAGTAKGDASVIFSELSGYDFDNLFYNPSSPVESDFEYMTEKSALMLALSAKGLTDTNKATIEYITTKNVTLSAENYYEINVLVKTVGGAKASVKLLTDNSADIGSEDSSFTEISTTSLTDFNGWTKYAFRLKVGFSAVDVQLGLYLDLPEGADKSGIAFFDRVTMNTLNEDDFVADTNVKTVALEVDSFGLSSSSTFPTTGAYIKPTSSSWVGTADVTSDENSRFGIISDKYDFENNHNGLENVLKGNGSSSALVIYNHANGAYHFSNANGKTFSANRYYKVSVYVKTYSIPSTLAGAYVKVSAKGYDDDSDYLVGTNKLYINTGDTNAYQKVEFFIKTPKTNSLSSAVKLTLGLGEVIGDDEKLMAGFAIFDDVSFELLDEITNDEQFEAAISLSKSNLGENYVSSVEYKDIDSTTVDPSTPPTDPEDKKGNFNWIIFTSVAFGAIIIIVVVVYFVKKYLPKRKEKLANTVADKKVEKNKDDKYKNLKD